MTKLLQQVSEFIESRCQDDVPLEDGVVDLEEGTGQDAPNNTNVCRIHTSLPNVDESRMQALVESLLRRQSTHTSNDANNNINNNHNNNQNDEGQHRLAFLADPKLADPRGMVRKALDLWLCAQGYYPNTTTTTGNSNSNNSMVWQAGVVTSHLAMDRTAAECIHLFPPPHAGVAMAVGGPNMAHNSLWGILSQPLLTKMGKRRLQVWVRQPLVELAQIVQRQNAVECLVQHGIGRDRLRDEGLKNFTSVDLDRLAVRLGQYQPLDEAEEEHATSTASTNTRVALELLYQLYMLATQKVPLLAQVLHEILPTTVEDSSNMDTRAATPDSVEESNNDENILKSLLNSLTHALANIGRGEELASSVLDLDAAPREFRVKSSYKPELQEIEEELQGVDAELEECHKAMQDVWQQVSGQAGTQVRLEMGTDSGDGGYNWQFRLPNTNDSKVLEQELARDVKVHRILKNGVYFSNDELRGLATKKEELMREYDKHQQELVQQAMKVASTYQPVIELISDIVAQLDVLAGLAHVAAYSPHGYCRPVMTDGEEDGLGIEVCHIFRWVNLHMKGFFNNYPSILAFLLVFTASRRSSPMCRVTGEYRVYSKRYSLNLWRIVIFDCHGSQHGRQVNVHSYGGMYSGVGANGRLCAVPGGQDQHLSSHFGSRGCR